MHLVQYLNSDGSRRVGAVVGTGDMIREIEGATSTYELATSAVRQGLGLVDIVALKRPGVLHEYDRLLAERRILLPFDHPDPAHCLVTGTGLTHLGSAKSRDAMHARIAGDESALTDSMKMFRWGVEGGKPDNGQAPVQPEWFYKGDGSWLIPPEGDLIRPAFAEDGGEESELVGLYLIGPDGTPHRVGFALGNEFSDHVMEKRNYLYLAHSKLRMSSFGPELLVGPLPSNVTGQARLLRDGSTVWKDCFYSGEDQMSYRISGLEYHHFKYAGFRRPGDVHCHYFGTSLLSFSAGVSAQDGDIFEISAPPFHRPLRNRVRFSAEPNSNDVKTL